jgi:NTE family protein
MAVSTDYLGLAPLLSGRSVNHTSHVYNLDDVIAVDAGQGRSVRRSPNISCLAVSSGPSNRLQQGAGRAQGWPRARLTGAVEVATIQGYINPYLATHDKRLPLPLADFVPRQAVVNYPTDFAA